MYTRRVVRTVLRRGVVSSSVCVCGGQRGAVYTRRVVRTVLRRGVVVSSSVCVCGGQ